MTDDEFLRLAIAQARAARDSGNDPFGSVLVAPDGAVLAQEHNTVRSDNDISAHPEFKLARWAAANLAPDLAAATTMYTSCQPCQMCAGAIARSGLGRVVYALSNEQYAALFPDEAWPVVPQVGPSLYDEAKAVFDRD
jgi:tRNA(Arg) A34 adenosine deaminase TadA